MYRHRQIYEERQQRHDETISDERYWKTVVHEAAHAVVAERLQPGTALSIAVFPADVGWAGEAAIDMLEGSRNFALACLAGAAAERLWVERTRDARVENWRDGLRLHTEPGGLPIPSLGDEDGVEAYLNRAIGNRYLERRKIERRELEREARQLVRENARAISRLAKAYVIKDDYQGRTRMSRELIVGLIGRAA